MKRLRLGISSCLLGNMVRYDGGHKLDRSLIESFGGHIEWVAVCPEVESGLSVPREAMQLEGNLDAPRIITIETRIDHTDRITTWAIGKVQSLKQLGICGFVFKSRSPSCGIRDVEIYSGNGTAKATGPGLFARTIMEHIPHLPVEDEAGLHDNKLREDFVERACSFCSIKM